MARKHKEKEFYPEEELIELVQEGHFSWVDYVMHYSREWRDEFLSFLREFNTQPTNSNALAYIAFREDLLEEGMQMGLA